MWISKLNQILPQLKTIIGRAIGFVVTLELIKLAPPYLMKLVIDGLLLPEVSLVYVYGLVGGILVLSLLGTMVEDLYILFTAMSVFNVETSILKKGHAKLLSLDLRHHESHPSGESVQLMNKGSSRLAELVWFVNDQFLGAFFQIIFTSILLLYVHFWCGMVFVLFMPLVLIQVHRSGKKVQPYRNEYHAKFREASWEMNQSLINVRTVKDFVQEAKERNKYDSLLNRYIDLAQIRIKVEGDDTKIRDILLGIARFAVIIYAVYLVAKGEMTTGTLVLFATLSEKVIASLFRLGRLYNFLGDSMESIRQFCELFDQQPEIVEREDALRCDKLKGGIDFNAVSFSYDNNQRVLKDINLQVPANTVTALVGRSGSGKTTMIKLLGRHYDVSEGAISVDGVDIRDYKIADYRKQIAVVSQDIEVFDCSVAENIAYGIDASQEVIEQAAKAAHAHEFIIRLPEGYRTRIGERGVKLSGGQKQRLGIARALVVSPAILVFDEATSSLDTESEREIQLALQKLSTSHTMIIIAHRLSTIEKADLIVVMDDGSIVESGNHLELNHQDGHFAYMKRLQDLGELRE
ncbi:MAG: ABC transporter ATP-binding protein [Bdellovibrionales bacterium]|nr:ABC transporter ATP-binding protein [Bdellovibrionales bacterium]